MRSTLAGESTGHGSAGGFLDKLGMTIWADTRPVLTRTSRHNASDTGPQLWRTRLNTNTHPHGSGRILQAGAPLEDANKVIILMHGRGASAADIIRLGSSLVGEDGDGVTFLAPEATNNTWYPVSGFLPQEQLAPWLESALTVIDDIIDTAVDSGVANEKIILGGFSQGAMLSLEYASRGRRKIGGVIAFSGSIIGPVDQPYTVSGEVSGMPMFIGCGTNDSWIPADAARNSAQVFVDAGADVDLRIYEGMEHIINEDEIEGAAALVARV